MEERPRGRNQHPFTMAVGGGIDLNAGKHFAFRLGEIDYVLTRYTNPSPRPTIKTTSATWAESCLSSAANRWRGIASAKPQEIIWFGVRGPRPCQTGRR